MNNLHTSSNQGSGSLPDIFQKMLDLPIDDNAVLLESGQGWHANGNPFAIAYEIEKDPEYKDLKLFFTARPENISDISSKFEKYGFSRTTPLIIDSPEYMKALASSKYLVTDNSFPAYFIKRPKQVYINTWHGTPIKCLGRSDIEHASSIGNIQTNYFACDFMLFPNEYTRDIFYQDYMLDMFGTARPFLMDYPRDSFLVRPSETAGDIPDLLDLKGKTVAAYMPTWRRISDPAEQKKHDDKFLANLAELDRSLDDDTVLLINLHFLETSNADLSAFRHIKLFPGGYETYDVLSYCDILISDYSSVIFDYAVLNRKIVLFAYDSEEYADNTGLYFPLEDMGFPVVRDIASLAEELKDTAPNISPEFSAKFCSHKDPDAPRKIMEKLMSCEKQNMNSTEKNVRKNVLYYAGDLADAENRKHISEAVRKIDTETENPILVFRNAIDDRTVGPFLRTIPRSVNFIRVPMYGNDSREIKTGLMIYKATGRFTHALRNYYRYEQMRFAAGWKADDVRFLSDSRSKLKGLLEYILRSKTEK